MIWDEGMDKLEALIDALKKKMRPRSDEDAAAMVAYNKRKFKKIKNNKGGD